MANINNITSEERATAEEETSEAVKAALLISGANKKRFGSIKNDLGNSYLMGTNQCPNTPEKARIILGNYKPLCTHHNRPPHNNGGVAFLRRGRGSNGDRGRGGA